MRDNPRDAWVECAHAAADMYVVAHLSIYIEIYVITHISIYMYIRLYVFLYSPVVRGGGLGSSTIFKKFHETYAPS